MTRIGKVRILSLGRNHLDAVVRIHLAAFPAFFLTFLGPRFLGEFYAGFVRDAAALAFVAQDDDGAVHGFVVGTATPAGFFKRLLVGRWWAFALTIAIPVLRRPSAVRRLMRGMWYRGDAPDRQQRSLLSSLAVTPQSQGTGVGRKLVEHWLAEARRRGCTGAFLTTDSEGNAAVNDFYHRLGWRLETSYLTPEGRQMNRYVFDF